MQLPVLVVVVAVLAVITRAITAVIIPCDHF
jgi:hypothetical protein